MQRKLSEIRNDVKKVADCRELFSQYFPENYHKTGNCVCPWHPDSDPSLEITRDKLFCYGGCSTDGKPKKRDAIDLMMLVGGLSNFAATLKLARDLNVPIEATTAGHGPKTRYALENASVVYDYHDLTGEIPFKVGRFPKPNSGKDFRPFTPNDRGQWTQGMKRVPRILYRLPELNEADPDLPVIFVEGEKDVDSVRELGFVATTSPGGSNGWNASVKDGAHEALKGRDVWLVGDHDQAGEQYVKGVAKTLDGVARSIRILTLPDLPEKGDISDFIETHGPDKTKEEVLSLARRTVPLRPANPRIEEMDTNELIETAIPPPNWIIKDILSEGLTMLSAKPKAGKSWMVHNLGLAIVNEIPALGHFPIVTSGKTLNICLEDTLGSAKERMEMIIPSNNRYGHRIACGWPSYDAGGLDELQKRLLNDPKIRLISIDTYAKFRGRKGQNDDSYAGELADLNELYQIATYFKVGILIVHHLKKSTTEDPLDQILGSTALAATCDSHLILVRKNDRQDMTAVLHAVGRRVHDTQFALSFEAGRWTYQGDPFELQMSAERREIRNILKFAGKPMKPVDIAALTEPKRHRRSVQKTLSRMSEAGEVIKGVAYGSYLLPPEDELYQPPRGVKEEPKEEQYEIDLEKL